MPDNFPAANMITEVTSVLRNAIQELIIHDSDIFDIELVEPPILSEDARILNRELHEVAINHRLAVYIEREIQKLPHLQHYKVDIEYNRYYEEEKRAEGVEGAIRPDILVHTRMNRNYDPQHLIVIEAKKHIISRDDDAKVRALMNDPKYNYMFGFTISYCHHANFILGKLYYKNENGLINTDLNVRKGNR